MVDVKEIIGNLGRSEPIAVNLAGYIKQAIDTSKEGGQVDDRFLCAVLITLASPDSRDLHLFRVAIGYLAPLISPRYLSLLLFQLLSSYDDQALYVLLQASDAKRYIEDSSLTTEQIESGNFDVLTSFARFLRMIGQDSLDHPEFELDRKKMEERRCKIFQCAKLMIDFGANMNRTFMLPSRLGNGEHHVVALHTMAEACIQGGSPLMNLIMESTFIENCVNDKMPMTPVYTTIEEICHCDSSRIHHITSMIEFCAIPLLKCGIKAEPDFLEPKEGECLKESLYNLLESNFRDDIEFVIWSHRGTTLFNFLLESRQKSTFNYGLFRQGVMNHVNTLLIPLILRNDIKKQDRLVRMVANILLMAKCSVPMRLQSLCRIAVLNQLPVGLKQRREAIDSLPLPSLFKRFLNFHDLKVKNPSKL